ncbi:MAG: nucleotide sugar dehydrogenase [Christensenellaceae bacterium]|jgi:UDP-N-acetyl-D-galactosamine dehydrogenase|nr:nucleotide sugar dehydrogenase [Christensenellaceae bacterium]
MQRGEMVYDKICNGETSIGVIGLGYVGLPLAAEFARRGVKVIGYDISFTKIEKYISGIDVTREIGNESLRSSGIEFTCDENKLKLCKFLIVAVPTPVSQDKMPDLSPVTSASEVVGRTVSKDCIVVYESTVYPGVTEDICAPIIEKISGLRVGLDFKIGYSPERINPGDPIHRVNNIVKIVSGCDDGALDEIAMTYSLIIDVGVYRAESIKIAEAAKVVENSQRDINIAFMNELAMAFDIMEIDTSRVVAAMNTKWNALGFTPGLVGGHCIGVDPYYFIYKAEQLGYHSQIVAAGRRINDGMGKFVAERTIKLMIKEGMRIKGSRVLVLGATFKENCPDIRNSKVNDIIESLLEYDVEMFVYDPVAGKDEFSNCYASLSVEETMLVNFDCIICAVKHNEFLALGLDGIDKMYGNNGKVLIDVKSAFSTQLAKQLGIAYWNL